MEYAAVKPGSFVNSKNDNDEMIVTISMSDDGTSVFVEAIQVEMSDAVVLEVSVVDEDGNKVCITYV